MSEELKDLFTLKHRQDCHIVEEQVGQNGTATNPNFGTIALSHLTFINNLDPFNVYKVLPENDRPRKVDSHREGRVLANPELRIEYSEWDSWRRPISYAILVSAAFLFLKFFIFDLILIMYFEIFPCKRKTTRMLIENVNSTNNHDPICMLDGVIIGIPMATPNKIFLSAIGIICLIVRVSLYRLQRTAGFNLGPIRFYSNPKCEHLRLDLLARDLLDELRSSQIFFRSQMFQSIRYRATKESKTSDQIEHVGISNELESFSLIMNLLEDDREQHQKYLESAKICHLRPEIYDLKCFGRSLKLISYIYPTVVVLFYLFSITFASLVVEISLNSFTDLEIAAASKEKQYQLIIELTVIVVLFGQPFLLIGFVGVSTLIYYNRLLNCTKDRLQSTIRRLRQISSQLAAVTQNRKSVVQILGRYKSFTKEKISLDVRLKFEANREASNLLLKFMVYRHELRNMARGLASIFQIPLLSFIVSIICIVATEAAKVTEIQLGRYVLFPIALISANLIAIVSCVASERVSQLERISWSILAEMTAISSQAHDGSRIWHRTGGLGFSSFIWRRYVCQSRYWHTELVPKPCGITINYHRIIEANFFLISIVTVFILR